MTVTRKRNVVQCTKSGAQQLGRSIEQAGFSIADTVRPPMPGSSGLADALLPPLMSQTDASPAASHRLPKQKDNGSADALPSPPLPQPRNGPGAGIAEALRQRRLQAEVQRTRAIRIPACIPRGGWKPGGALPNPRGRHRATTDYGQRTTMPPTNLQNQWKRRARASKSSRSMTRRTPAGREVGSIEQFRISPADTIRPSMPGGSGSAVAFPPPPTSQADANPAATH